MVGKTRYVVLVAVAAVLLVSISLFLLGAAQGVAVTLRAWDDAFRLGKFGSTDLTVEFLAVIGVMLRAVVLHLIGVGLYSLFIGPLNLTAALGVESLVDLETKVISVVVVILALVLFQWNSRQGKEFAATHKPDEQKHAASELFNADREERTVNAGSKGGSTSA